MKPIWLSLAAIFIACSFFSFKTPISSNTPNYLEHRAFSNLSDFEIRQRLDDLGGMVDLKYNSDVERNIKRYLKGSHKYLPTIIGKSERYFPMFEHYLLVKGLPDELKYLAVVESELNPSAKSSGRAAGLWQFMKGTGLNYGLKVDSYVDERNDPIKSTEAALDYLTDLYQRYGDWTLALAAYNCGPSRLNRAIRKANTKNYWKLRKFLPSETQNYIPAFVAATYVMNYYPLHEVHPKVSDYPFKNLRTITIFKATSFYNISKMSGVSLTEIQKLNPAYKKDFIPSSKYGNYLTLPVVGMSKYKTSQQEKKWSGFYENTTNLPSDMIQSTYVVQKGESLNYIAKILRCTTEDLVKWNKLPVPSTFNGQELVVYFPKEKLNLEKNIVRS